MKTQDHHYMLVAAIELFAGALLAQGCIVTPASSEPTVDDDSSNTILVEDASGVHRVHYDVIGAHAIYDGCIDLGRVDELRGKLRGAHGVPLHVDWHTIDPLHPNQVPYTIDPLLGNETTPGTDAYEVVDAIHRWESQTPLKFCKKNTTDCAGPKYVYFDRMNHPPIDDDPASSFTHTMSYGFRISHPTGKGSAALHEIGHAMGWPHEQRRSDRDLYVSYYPECLNDDESHAFDKNDPGDDALLAPYDVTSVMQYSSFGKSIDSVKDDPDGDGIPNACPTLLQKYSDGLAHLASFEQTVPPFYQKYYWGIEIHSQDPRYLSVEDINVAYQQYEPVIGSNADSDHFGSTAVSADFDGDGYADLAVGAPNNLNGGIRSGAVFLYKGTYHGLVAWKALLASDFGASPHAGDAFGAALAAYNVDDTGKDVELVIGAPGWQVGSADNAGAIFVYRQRYSGVDNLVREGPKPVAMFTQAAAGFGSASADDRFGAALAIGRFAGPSARPVLLVGAPGEVYAGKKTGFVSAFTWGLNDQLTPLTGFTAGSLEPSPGDGDLFGSALAVADWNDDGYDDVVVGAPMTGVAGKAGAAYWFTGRAASGTQAPVAARQRIVDPDPAAGGRYGTAVVAGDFDGATWTHGRRPQLAVGAPGKFTSRGKVHVFTPTSTLLGYGLQFSQSVDQTIFGNVNQNNDELGQVLAAADVTHDGKDELFVGVPRRNQALTDDGIVYIYEGSATFTSGWSFDDPGPLWVHQANDHWGSALAIGDFDHDGNLDFAAGLDGVDAGGHDDAGGVTIMKGHGAAGFLYWTAFDQSSSTPE